MNSFSDRLLELTCFKINRLCFEIAEHARAHAADYMAQPTNYAKLIGENASMETLADSLSALCSGRSTRSTGAWAGRPRSPGMLTSSWQHPPRA